MFFMLSLKMFDAVKRGDSQLAWIIFTNGLAYFTVVTIFCIASFFFFVALPDSQLLVPSALTSLMQSISSVLSCRLMLHLREYAHQGDFTSDLMSIPVNLTRLHTMEFAGEVNESVSDGTSSTCDHLDIIEP
ncbi:hypothetical protein SCHPADRAFT_387729 [Schizopora paradoxa]|uniref:Uncharacterized protein n=1 Tax=Schizopora paradoxa TaxID=27342 RepID=A0A0H2RU68_9AGAM|nr:hypothetical protein SCHPADRAFT_387729 [Schizopora paradoxa]